jgi:hypothetical protein
MQLIHMDDEVEKESEDYEEEEGVGDTSLLADMRFRQARSVRNHTQLFSSVADPGSGIRCLFDSGIRDR